MQVVQPYDGALIAELTPDTLADVERKLELALATFKDRANWLPAYRRIEILKKLAGLVTRDAEALALTIAREGGKPLTDARVEVARAANGIEGAAAAIEHMVGTEVPMNLTPASAGRWAFRTKEPVGVVVAVSAFNHPLNLIVHQAVPAIATGCPVVVKPAATTPLSCLRLVELAREAGLPEGWCQAVVTDDNALAERLVTDGRIAFLSFIGSAKVGWYLRSKLAAGVRFALEHGGAAPAIVDATADLDAVLAPLAKGGYYHAGQVCVSVQRIYVAEERKREFVERFAELVRGLKVGDPAEAETEVGPLILPREVDRVSSWVDAAVEGGATVPVGGKRVSERVYGPTLLVEPAAEALVSTREIFGPVTCVYGFTSLEEAIARANSLPVAFQASVFTRELQTALTAARLFDASAVMINDHTAFRTDWMPFAGRRESGYGIGGIPYTMHDLMQDKMIVLRY